MNSGKLSLIALMIGSLTLAACSDGGAPAAPTMGPMPVTVLEMQPQKVPTSIEVMAQTEGARETEVRARIGGILLKRLYQEGDVVKSGQPLFQIDRAPYEIALAETRARADQTAREKQRLKGLAEAKAISQKITSVVCRKAGAGTASATQASAAPTTNCSATIQRRLVPSRSTSGPHSGLMTHGR